MSAALVFDIAASTDEQQKTQKYDSSAARHLRGVSRHEEVAIDPELSLYRQRCIALLRRYFRMSIELGRLPNILGREFFRSKVSSYRISTFEDVVILVHDVDRCLSRLEQFDQQLVASVVLEEYSHSEAAELLRVTRRTVTRRVPEALDLLSKIFLETGLLKPIGQENSRGRAQKNPAPETCQEGEIGDFDVSA